MADWLIRALKTFVQAFFGVLIPELCVILNGGFPESIETTWVIYEDSYPWHILALSWRRHFPPVFPLHGTSSVRSSKNLNYGKRDGQMAVPLLFLSSNRSSNRAIFFCFSLFF